MSGTRASFPIWTETALDQDRLRAIDAFIERWEKTGTLPWQKTFSSLEPKVEELFALSDDLRKLDAAFVAANPSLVPLLRFLSSPPVSEDDLDTLVGQHVARRKKLTEEQARRIITVVVATMDPLRLPWLRENRVPTLQERLLALKWTTGLLALQRLGTDKRMLSSRSQQRAVQDVLTRAGLSFIPDRIPITDLDNLPRGSFKAETLLAGVKCDFPVRLHDGRLLAIECKVSNSAINSVKRLIHETGHKADAWRHEFGERIIPAAVLSGIYKLHNLRRAQDEFRIAIFWEHDLNPLTAFLEQVRQDI